MKPGMRMERRTVGCLLASALAVFALAGCSDSDAAQTAELRQPSYYFRVLVDGVEVDSVLAVSGLGVDVEAKETEDPTDPLVRKRPGRVKYGNVTLKRAYTGDTTFSSWINEAQDGSLRSRSVTVEILGLPTGKRIRQYEFLECWPTRWALEDDSDGDGLEDVDRQAGLVEVVVLSADSFTES